MNQNEDRSLALNEPSSLSGNFRGLRNRPRTASGAVGVEGRAPLLAPAVFTVAMAVLVVARCWSLGKSPPPCGS